MGRCLCAECNKVVGTTSLPEDDLAYKCAECYDKQELEYHLLQGKNYDPQYLNDEEVKKIVKKVSVKDEQMLKAFRYCEKVEKAKKDLNIITSSTL